MIRRTALASVLLCFVLSVTHAEDAQRPRASASGQIQVKVVGLRNGRGQVLVALWRSPKNFPGTPPAGTATRTAKIRQGVSESQFDDVTPGNFAITVFHDEDGDTELKTNFIGIPKEGIGFSRNPRVRFGAPDYEDAMLTLAPGEHAVVKISLQYL